MPSSRRSTAAFPHSRALVPELSDPLKLVPPEARSFQPPHGFLSGIEQRSEHPTSYTFAKQLRIGPEGLSGGERVGAFSFLGSKGSTVLHLADGRKLTRFFLIYMF